MGKRHWHTQKDNGLSTGFGNSHKRSSYVNIIANDNLICVLPLENMTNGSTTVTAIGRVTVLGYTDAIGQTISYGTFRQVSYMPKRGNVAIMINGTKYDMFYHIMCHCSFCEHTELTAAKIVENTRQQKW